MLKVLITGADSYIGTQLAHDLDGQPEVFETHTLDVRGTWKPEAFDGMDAVVHVAGIAHIRETPQNAPLYDAVNRALTLEIAKAAKARGVRQFVFFSSMSVYGLNCGHITASTPVVPKTCYGKSKWEAEQGLRTLEDERFRVAVLRPPMIYGRGCKGNYPKLSALIRRLPVFPRVDNERSMLYIGCLCGFMKRLLRSGEGGLFFPQNREYVSVGALAGQIALCAGHRLWRPRGFGWLLTALSKRADVIGKVFGSLTYDRALSVAFSDEPQPDFNETIRRTEAAQ